MGNDEMLVVIKQMFENSIDKIEKKFDEKTDEIKQYVDKKINGQGVIIESLHGDIKNIAEGHGILNRKIDALDKKVDVIYIKVDDTRMELTARINKMDKNMEIVKDYVIGVDTKFNEYETILKRVNLI